ncbi:twin-arginine translocation signal domain-containing protein [Mesorhizobium sp. ANAO-SY3R2]|uniref:twin-arginine translocation signal domain-containing protein n=1 Tax=Mesorhizobium sp. ANAO-SY3R2 TaxID=3166644 RepID=UPI00366AC683
MSITRRIFLRQAACAGAAVTVSAPAVAEAAASIHEQVEASAEDLRQKLASMHGGLWDIHIDHITHFVAVSRRIIV